MINSHILFHRTGHATVQEITKSNRNCNITNQHYSIHRRHQSSRSKKRICIRGWRKTIREIGEKEKEEIPEISVNKGKMEITDEYKSSEQRIKAHEMETNIFYHFNDVNSVNRVSFSQIIRFYAIFC